MNPEICRKCNIMRAFYYFDKNKIAICINRDDFIMDSEIMNHFNKFIKQNSKFLSETDTFIHIGIKDDNFYGILPSLTIYDNCPYYLEHNIYDWNKK